MDLAEKEQKVIYSQVQKSFSEMELYNDLYFFYDDLFKQEYKYIIIVPRKCLTEFKCMRLANQELVNTTSIITTPTGISQHIQQIQNDINKLKDGEQLPDNYLAVVDDIVIYGRGLTRILKQLYGMFSEEDAQKLMQKTYLETFIESNCASFIKDKFEDIYQNRFNTVKMGYDKPAYRKVSDLFINSFYSVPIPNTSYVRSWKFSCENIQSVVEKFMQGDKERNTEDRDSSYPDEYKFELIYDKNNWDGGILSYFNCIRFYYNERTKICFVTPYVFLKTMSESEIDKIFSILQNFIPKNLFQWRLEDNDFKKATYILKYEYLTLLLSDIYGLLSYKADSEKEECEFEIEDDTDVLEFTYGVGNVTNLGKIKKILDMNTDFLSQINQLKIDGVNDRYNKDEIDAVNLFADINKNSVKDTILEYFLKNGELDDKRAEEGEERIWGITLETMQKMLNEKCNEKYDDNSFFYYLLQCMDSGKCALTVKATEEGEAHRYYSILNAGEQAYRIKMDSLMVCFKYLKKIEEDCINNLETTFVENMAQKFLDKVQSEKLMKSEDLDTVRMIINQTSVGKYKNLYVPRTMFKDEEKWENVYHSLY